MWDCQWSHENLLKLGMAAVFLYHGWTKNLQGFAQAFHLPVWVAGLVILAELLGGLGYLIGVCQSDQYFGLTPTQWASLAVIPVLVGAIYLVHWKKGFNVMNGGFEYQMMLLLVAIYLYLV